MEWVQRAWVDGVDMSHDQPFKAIHGYRCECYVAVVVETSYLVVLGYRDYGGLLETCTLPFKSLGSLRNILVFERKAIFCPLKLIRNTV